MRTNSIALLSNVAARTAAAAGGGGWTTVLSDDFTGTENQALGSRAGWTAEFEANTNNQLRINAFNQLKRVGANGQYAIYSVTAGVNATQAVQVTHRHDGSSDVHGGGVVNLSGAFASHTDWTGYFVNRRRGATSRVRLVRHDSGTTTNLIDEVVADQDGDVLRVEREGNDLRVYLNGTQLGATVTDATYLGGKAGLLWNTPDDPLFDDFLAEQK